MIKTDYCKIQDLYLAYPAGFDKEYSSMLCFFDELIFLVPDNIHLYIIVNNQQAIKRLKTIHPHKNITPLLIKGFYEPWLRDIMGFNFNEYIIKPLFKPDYYKDVYTDSYLKKTEGQVLRIIEDTLDKEIIHIPLIWDCGNLITNGEVGFISDKILKDNKDKKEREILGIIEKHLSIKPILFTPSKDDYLGHADGYLNFFSENDLGLAVYKDDDMCDADKRCIDKLEEIVESTGLNIIKLVNYTSSNTSRENEDCLYSAEGCYINSLRLNNTLIIPQFGAEIGCKDIDLNNYNREVVSRVVEDIRVINCDQIAKQGGVLRCLSFTN